MAAQWPCISAIMFVNGNGVVVDFIDNAGFCNQTLFETVSFIQNLDFIKKNNKFFEFVLTNGK